MNLGKKRKVIELPDVKPRKLPQRKQEPAKPERVEPGIPVPSWPVKEPAKVE